MLKKSMSITVPQKILVRVPNWLGDAVLAFPAVEALRGRFPTSQILLMTRPYLSELWLVQPAVDRVVAIRDGSKRAEVETALSLRREGVDLYLTFPRSFLSALTGLLAGAKLRVGYSSEGRGWLLTHRLRRDAETLKLHRVQYYLKLVEVFGEVSEVGPPKVTVTAEMREKGDEILRKGGLSASPKVGFNPGALYGEAKCWPQERFIELGRRLVEDGYKVLLFGTLGEQGRNAEIARGIGEGCLDLTGRTSLMELAVLLERCCCLVTNDTGTMHLSAAVGTPVVALFGSTDPALTSPVGDGHVIIRHRISCSPCFERVCPEGHHRCMRSIEVEEVLEAVKRVGGNGR